MGPMGDPLAPQPRGTRGGAQDSSMSNLQSSRKPDTKSVPCSSTQLSALSPSIVFQASVGMLAPAYQETSPGFFHTQHPCGSYPYTVTDVLGGSTKLPWEHFWWMKSPSPRNSNRKESHLPLPQMAGGNKTPSLQETVRSSLSLPFFLSVIRNQKELCPKANSDPEDQT